MEGLGFAAVYVAAAAVAAAVAAAAGSFGFASSRCCG